MAVRPSPLLGGCSAGLGSDVEAARAIRSTMTMMGYLARKHAAPVRPGSAVQRPSTAAVVPRSFGSPAGRPQSAAAASQCSSGPGVGEFDSLSSAGTLQAQLEAAQLQQVVRQTHAVAGDERSARVLEPALIDSVASLGQSLIAHAQARAAEEAAARAACQHRRRLGEERARGMGAVAPHRNAAQVAALAIGGPALQAQLSTSADRPWYSDRAAGCALLARDTQSSPTDAFPWAAVGPGSYVLRSWVARQAGGGPTGDRMYLSGAVRVGGGLVPALGSYAMARAAPVRVRATEGGGAGKGGGTTEAAVAACARASALHAGMPSRLHAGTSAYATLTAHGGTMMAGRDGQLTLGAPRTREDAQFVLLPLLQQEASALRAEERARTGNQKSPAVGEVRTDAAGACQRSRTAAPELPPSPQGDAGLCGLSAGAGGAAFSLPASSSFPAPAPALGATAAPPCHASRDPPLSVCQDRPCPPSVCLVRLLHVTSGKLLHADPTSARVCLVASGETVAAFAVFELCEHRRPGTVAQTRVSGRRVDSAPLMRPHVPYARVGWGEDGRVCDGDRALADEATAGAAALGAGSSAGVGADVEAEVGGGGDATTCSGSQPCGRRSLNDTFRELPLACEPAEATLGGGGHVSNDNRLEHPPACDPAEAPPGEQGELSGQGHGLPEDGPPPNVKGGGRWWEGGAGACADAEAGQPRVIYARRWEASATGAATGGGRARTAPACAMAGGRGMGSLGDGSVCSLLDSRSGAGTRESHRYTNGFAHCACGAPSTSHGCMGNGWPSEVEEAVADGRGELELAGAPVGGLARLGPARLDLRAVTSEARLRPATSAGRLSPSPYASACASAPASSAAPQAAKPCASSLSASTLASNIVPANTVPARSIPVGYTFLSSSRSAASGMRRPAVPVHIARRPASASAWLNSPQTAPHVRGAGGAAHHRWTTRAGGLAPAPTFAPTSTLPPRVGDASPSLLGWPAVSPDRMAASDALSAAQAAPDDLSTLIASWATRRTGRLPERL